jgi:hypothetical protein
MVRIGSATENMEKNRKTKQNRCLTRVGECGKKIPHCR